MKKRIALLLVFALVLGLCPTALAWGSSDGYTYSVTGSTNLFGASAQQLNNINLAISKINGTVINYNGSFSFNDTVGPRDSKYGYKNAVNGRGVTVCGGGVGQVVTTLYLAVRQLSGVQIDPFLTYGSKFTGSYVGSGDEAVVVDTQNNNDFTFHNKEGQLKIEMWATRNYLYCTVSVNNSQGSISTLGTQVGYASIALTGTNTLRNNVTLAAEKINGTTLNYYNEFSFNHIVGPRSKANGYGDAINGRGVRVTGGGVGQVASAVYLAVKSLSNVQFTEKMTYGARYNQNYVQSSADAIVVDYTNNNDFRFVYRGYGTLTIVTYVNASGSRLICEVYEKTGW